MITQSAPHLSRVPALALRCTATLAIVLLYVPWIAQPHIRYDDVNFLDQVSNVE